MKSRNSFLMRCLAMALALVLLVSNANLGVALRAFAAEEGGSVTAAEIVAYNYDLTEAEKALLNSGLLAGGSYDYTIPGSEDGLVTVDTENAKITAKNYENGPTWVPTTAEIVAGGTTVETVTLVDGVGSYDPAVGNAFAVKVTYKLDIEVPADTQQSLLNTAAWLKQGVTTLATAYEADTNLGTVTLAMDTLVDLADGISMKFVNPNDGSIMTMSASFGPDAQAAVYALEAQMDANGGSLDLQVKNTAYASATKTQYLLENGAAYKSDLVETYNYLAAIKADQLCNNSLLDGYLQMNDPTSYNQWAAFKSILNNLVATMEPAVNGDWNAAAEGTALVKSGITAAEYIALDGLVAALGETTTVAEIKNPLSVGEVQVQTNMSMFNVTVTVELKAVEDVVDSANLVYAGTETAVVTVAEGATAEEVLDEIAASGVEDVALAAWVAVYKAEHFDRTATDLPETLTADTTYTITYAPKNYTVTFDDEPDAPDSVPYGYQITLPVHTDATKSYDYTVNGASMAQGEVYTVVGATTITREAGKAYASSDLYSIIADNFATSDVTKEILKSGALNGNETIKYRQPDAADASELVTLSDGNLQAVGEYASAYQGLPWVPYGYGAVTGEENLFKGSTNAAWGEDQAKVKYVLNLANHTAEEVTGILEMVAALKAEADAQKAAMDGFASSHSTMKQLDKTKLGALNGVIDVTDFTPGDGTDADEKNVELRAEFKAIVSGIINGNVDANNMLKIYNMLEKYLDENNGGLAYYYSNSVAIIAEITALSEYLAGLMEEEEALKIMVVAALGQEDGERYVGMIGELETKLENVLAALSEPNSAIDLTSSGLGKLVAALESEEAVAYESNITSPWILSTTLTAQDESSRMAQVIIQIDGENKGAASTASFDRGYVLTDADVNDLLSKVNAAIDSALPYDAKYYNVSVTGGSVSELVGTALDDNINIYYNYTEKQYSVMIDGEDTQYITISGMTIKLPAHPTDGWSYSYIIGEKTDVSSGTYTFTEAELDALFANGSYTITRTETNEAAEKLEGSFGDWLVKDADGNVIAMVANVAGDKDGIMGFVSTIANAGYTYIALNGEPLLYMNDEDTLEVKLQTLINAILNDNTFGSQTLIDLGNNGQGKLVTADISVGNSAEDLDYTALDFTLNLTSVPAQMGTVATGLETVKNYMIFQSQDGVMGVVLNLPEKVYEAYLTALLATGNVDKTDMNAVNNEIAFMFLYDYIDLIINTDATTTTYTNTLDKLGYKKDLTGYEDYYQMLKSALTNDGFKTNTTEDDGEFDVNVAASGKTAIDKLLGLVGIDATSEEFKTYVGMIYEYKTDGAELTATAVATLGNLPTAYEALVLDINATGESTLKTYANKFDYTPDLPGRVASIAGDSVVILLDNVDGSLNFGSGRTVLDLNGYTVNGSVSSAGTLYIVDSRMETATNGSVTGGVQATAILGGKYGADVSSMLKEGYKQVDGVVQNALYTIESDGSNITFVINTDVMDDTSVTGYLPNAQALAVDIAVDLALNFFTAASLTADGNTIYAVNFDNLIALLGSSNKVDDVITKAVGSISADGITAFANTVLADLLDFGAVASALNGGEAVASYDLVTTPWYVKVSHETSEDYIDIAITSSSDEALAKGYNVSLKMTGDNKQIIADLCEELSNVVNEATVEVELDQPTYNGSSNTLSVVGRATANVDVDLTKNADYITVITVIMANGNPGANADAMVAGLNNNDMDAVKAAFDKMTVEDVFTALKKLNRNDDFATLASNAGVTIDVASAAELESIYRLVLCAAGKALDVLEITGRDSKLGGLDPDGDGVYEYTGKISRNGDVSARGYTAAYNVEYVEVTLKVALFGETDCLWGDANHDEIVNSDDASLIEEYVVKDGQLDVFFCTIRTDVNDDGVINTDDASLIREYCVGNITVFPAENK